LDSHPDNLDDITSNIQSDTPDPEEILINQQNVIQLREIVNQLKPGYKTLIELRYYKEYSYEEISAVLKIPIGTVKAQLYRAKSFIFNILSKTENKK
jgi:RNA polymerase sigma factor (sigma-70 family)